MENQCAFFVLASGHKYNKIRTGKYPHTKVSMHARDQHGKEKTLLLLHDLYSLMDFFCKKDFFIAKLVGVTCTFENYHVQLSS